MAVIIVRSARGKGHPSRQSYSASVFGFVGGLGVRIHRVLRRALVMLSFKHAFHLDPKEFPLCSFAFCSAWKHKTETVCILKLKRFEISL